MTLLYTIQRNPEAYAQSYIRTKGEDLIRELQGIPVAPSKWLMLRNPNNLAWNTEVQGLGTEKKIRKKYLSKGVRSGYDDEVPSEAARLMSCSINLPSYQGGESSLYWWLQARSSKNESPPIQFSGQYGPELTSFSKELSDDIENLKDSVTTGILLQMAVKNKSLLNKLMYSSKGWGYKYSYITTDASKRSLETPTEVIETLTQKPSIVPLYQNPQTRVVLTADKMLDPTNPNIRQNIEFTAYADNQKALDDFHRKVDTAFAQEKDRIKANYQARYRAMSLPQKFWHTLKFCTSDSYDERKRIKRESPYWFTP